MKTFFTLVTSLILSIAVFAAGGRPKSILTIKSADRGDIRVVIDGRRFEPNDNYMRIQGIDAGYHNVKVYRERNNGFFTIFGKRYEVVFSSSVSVRPRTNLLIAVDRFGRATVNESRMYGGWYDHDGRGFDNQDNRGYDNSNGRDQDPGMRDDKNWDNNHDFNFDRGNNYGDYSDRDGRDNHDNSSNKDGRDNRDGRFDDKGDKGYNNNSYNRAMNDYDFNRVLSSMDKEWFETNKAKSAAQIISTNYFTAAQVKQLIQLFSFETTKLDLAKQAYSKTIDQQNYFMVNEALTFSSSKDELARYIQKGNGKW